MYVKEAIVYAVASFLEILGQFVRISFFIGSFYLKFTIRKQKKYN